MRESEVESRVCGHAAIRGWKNIKLGQQGWPDRLFFKNGRSLFVEFKAPGKALRPLQLHRFGMLIEEDMNTYVIDSVEEGKRFFDEQG